MKKGWAISIMILWTAAFLCLGIFAGYEFSKAKITESLTELKTGKPETSYRAGTETILYASHENTGSAVFNDRPSPREASVAGVEQASESLTMKEDSIIVKDSSYTLRIYVLHKDSAEVQYFLDLKSKTVLRTDTLYITRVDTLRLTNYVEKPRLFFERAEVMYPSAAILSVITYLILK